MDCAILDKRSLFHQFWIQVVLCDFRILSKQGIYEAVDSVKAFLRSGEIKKLIDGEYSRTVEYGFGTVVNHYIPEWLVLSAEEYDVYTEFLF